MTATAERTPSAAAAPSSPDPRRRLLLGAFVVVLVASVVLRLVWDGPLWLDESLSAEIARRPLGAMFTALRHDGSPPLYYLLLHGWIAVFGDSTTAVRALSSLLSVLGLPLAWFAGRELGGRRLAGWTLLVTALSPWAFRYSTETRMYGLLFDLVLLGAIVLVRALRAPTALRLLGVALVTLAIAYTHYWGLYLLAPVGLALLVRRRWAVLGAMVVSVVGYLPWLPSLVYQLQHTGTPWAQPPSLSIFTDTVGQWGGPGQTGPLLGIGLLLVAVAGLAYRTRALPRVDARWLAAAALAPLVVALVLGEITHAGYAIRYTAVALPAYLLLVGLGLARLPRRGQLVAAGLITVLGLVAGISNAVTPRTQAGQVAAALARQAAPGDVVGYCPDQVAPAVYRLVPAAAGLQQVSYADPTEGPALVDWVDYAQHVADVTPQEFAQQLLRRAGGHTVWLVASPNYRLFQGTCEAVATDLATARGEGSTYVTLRGSVFEHESLTAYPVRRAG